MPTPIPNPISNYYCNSSFLATVRTYRYNDEAETNQARTWFNKQQQPDHAHTFKRRQNSYNTNKSISYRAPRMRILLAYYIKNEVYHMCRLRKYHQSNTEFDTLPRGGIIIKMSVTCRFCGTFIVFDDNVLSRSGKRIPLQEGNHKVHDCKLNPYNQNRTARARKINAKAIAKEPLQNIEEYQMVQDARAHIVNLNNRLGSYELSLVVREKTQPDEFVEESTDDGVRIS
jgi:hypothetical protein